MFSMLLKTLKTFELHQDGEAAAALTGHLPKALVEAFATSGFGAYGGGLFTTCVHEELMAGIEMPEGIEGTVFAYTCFGDLFLWNGGVHLLFVQTGELVEQGEDPQDFFYSAFYGEDYTRDVLGRAQFKRLVKRLGPLKAGECFGLVPLPALGGSGREDSFQKLRVREYVALALQSLG